MAKGESLSGRIEKWVGEGLISFEQAQRLKRREAESVAISLARRVRADEILVYLGSLVVLVAMAFLVMLNWRALGSAGRILSVLVPTVVMLALGWWLRGSERARLRRGAQALWLGGCLLSALSFGVILDETYSIDWVGLGPGDPLLLASCLLATGVAGVAFVLLPSVPQSVAFQLCGSATLFSFLGWLDHILPPFGRFYENLGILVICLVAGGLWLALSEWLWARQRRGLVRVSRIVGTGIVLGSAFVLGMEYEYPAPWQGIAMEAIAFVASIAFLAASVNRQSPTFLYGGAATLLVVILHVNGEHFADSIGMPIALLTTGVVLIGLGLGTGGIDSRLEL